MTTPGGTKVPPQLMFDDGRRAMRVETDTTVPCCTSSSARVDPEIDEHNIEEYFEIQRLSQEIVQLFKSTLSTSSSPSPRQTGLLKIGIQFPDSMLHNSPEVVWMVEKRVNDTLRDTDRNCEISVFCFVLGDTTSNDCCADEVAAHHLDADVLVHYGHACLSATSGNIPVLYSFGRSDINVAKAVERLEEALSSSDNDNKPMKFLILYQVEYHHAISDLTSQWSARHKDDSEFQVVAGKIPTIRNKSFSSSLTLAGLELPQLSWDDLADYTVVFILENVEENTSTSRQHKVYINAMLQLLSRGDTEDRYWIYSPPANSLCTQPKSLTALQRQLKRRFFLTTKARDANVFGILVSNLGQRNLVEVVKSLQRLVQDAGKTAYSFAVGKINPAKLANFADIEVFCLVSCQEHALLDSTTEREDYATPVITPMELEIALGKLNWAEQPYSLDCQDVLRSAGGNTTSNGTSDDEGDSDDDTPYFSLATGKLIQKQRRIPKNEMENTASNEEANATKDGTIIKYESMAANFLNTREYKGLEALTGATEAKSAVQGLVGIASQYKTQGDTTDKL
mmetsp:Transcript_29778/g.72119  ORF Transcript_29778/g.72119 Transcript_29778/m.72119 type:complete len:567 (+) Transcript_29778:133-1833(+)